MHRIKIFHCQYIQSGFMISLLWQLKFISIMHVLYTNMTINILWYVYKKDVRLKRVWVFLSARKGTFYLHKTIRFKHDAYCTACTLSCKFYDDSITINWSRFYNVDIAEKKNLLQISFLILRLTYIIYILSQITSYTGEMFICNTT